MNLVAARLYPRRRLLLRQVLGLVELLPTSGKLARIRGDLIGLSPPLLVEGRPALRSLAHRDLEPPAHEGKRAQVLEVQGLKHRTVK